MRNSYSTALYHSFHDCCKIVPDYISLMNRVKWVPCHHMACSKAEDGADGLKMR